MNDLGFEPNTVYQIASIQTIRQTDGANMVHGKGVIYCYNVIQMKWILY